MTFHGDKIKFSKGQEEQEAYKRQKRTCMERKGKITERNERKRHVKGQEKALTDGKGKIRELGEKKTYKGTKIAPMHIKGKFIKNKGVKHI